jgi:hypothetical protein
MAGEGKFFARGEDANQHAALTFGGFVAREEPCATRN